MKKLFYFAAIAAMAGAMASCSNDDDVLTTPEQQSNLGIEVTIDKGLSTRAVAEDISAFAAGGKIAVSVFTASNLSAVSEDVKYGNGWKNIEYTLGTGTSATWSGNITLNNTTGYVYAYYPRQESVSDLAAVPIANTNDWMYGVGASAVNTLKDNTTITMYHALAKIIVTIKKDNYTGTGSATNVKVTSEGMSTKGTLNTLNGTVTLATSGGNNYVEMAKTLSLTDAYQSFDTWMVVPGATANDIAVEATIDGQLYKTSFSSVTLVNGKIFTLPLILSDRGLVINSVTVTPWADADAIAESNLTPSND